ncbi:hypothetical protein [Dongia sp.]|uniref:hypothetical protein n=1 Tax=Dongia sp. TaxID=1977262 RepID=UPI0035AD7CA6
MQSDWDSLFFTYRPHADQIPHEERLLADIGLTRTALGELARAEDPARPIRAPKRSWWQTLRDQIYARRDRCLSGRGVSGSASAMR